MHTLVKLVALSVQKYYGSHGNAIEKM